MTSVFSGLDRLPLSDGRDGLSGDLARAGYLRGAFDRHGEQWSTWFQTELVLSRPGLLSRCAALLQRHVPDSADRIAARGAPAVALAAAVSLHANIPMLFCIDEEDGSVRVGGDLFPGARI